MNCEQLLKKYDTQAGVAAALSVSRQLVHGWFKRQHIPLDQQVLIELKTNGELLADLPAAVRGVGPSSEPDASAGVVTGVRAVLDRLIARAGGLKKFSHQIGESPDTVTEWRLHGVTVAGCKTIERIYKLDRVLLRPDIFGG